MFLIKCSNCGELPKIVSDIQKLTCGKSSVGFRVECCGKSTTRMTTKNAAARVWNTS